MSAKRDMVAAEPKAPSLRRQCELVGLNRASWYRQPMQPAVETDENLTLMRRLDKLYTSSPFYGSRKFVSVLRGEGYPVNRKRIRRLMRLMGLVSLAPTPNTSQPHPGHPIYSYLLRGVRIDRVNQVWSTDIP